MKEFIDPISANKQIKAHAFVHQSPAVNIKKPSELNSGGLKKSQFVVHDADLLIPPSRNNDSAFGNVSPHIVPESSYLNTHEIAIALAKQKVNNPQPKPKPDLQASFGDLQDMVRRLTSMLAFYQEKYPATSLSVLGHELEVQVRQNEAPQVRYAFLHPLVKAYDEKLQESERLVTALQSNVNQLNDKVRDLVRGNQETFKTLQSNFEGQSSQQLSELKAFEAKIETLTRENELLLAEQKKNETLLQKAFTVQKTVPLLQNHISSLRSLSTTQSETITTLSVSAATLETKLDDSLNRIEHLTQRNKDLVDRCLMYENNFSKKSEEAEKALRDFEKAQKWRAQHEGVVEDWQGAVEALGLTQLLGDNVLTAESLHFRSVLSNHVKRQKKELEETVARARELEEKERKLEQENTSIVQSFVLQIEKKNVELQFHKNQYESIAQTLESLRHGKENAVIESQKAARETAQLDARLKDTIHQRDKDMADIIQNTNNKLRQIRQDHDEDRIRYQSQIEQLQQSKIELQCEIGHLLRDKRTTEFELEQALKEQNIARAQFQKEFKIAA